MNFYLSAVDDQMRHKDDAPTIGLLLCKKACACIASTFASIHTQEYHVRAASVVMPAMSA
jgi:hypothetical protein